MEEFEHILVLQEKLHWISDSTERQYDSTTIIIIIIIITYHVHFLSYWQDQKIMSLFIDAVIGSSISAYDPNNPYNPTQRGTVALDLGKYFPAWAHLRNSCV